MEYQNTIKSAFELEGVGLHSGVKTKIKVLPASPNHGIVFKRVDLDEEVLIPGNIKYVEHTERGTFLKKGSHTVATVEHLMSALYGMQIDNALIEVSGPEIPILDGSAGPFVDKIMEVGIQEQPEVAKIIELNRIVRYVNKQQNIELIAIPDSKFSVNVLIDYNSTVLANQYAVLNDIKDYPKEIAKARTFVFFREVEYLYKKNLIKGGDIDNAIVILDSDVSKEEIDRIADLFNKPHLNLIPHKGILNNVELNYPNEPARHKLLDVMGDIALLGKRLNARVIAMKPGHTANIEFGRKMLGVYEKEQARKLPFEIDLNQEPIFDVNDIKKILPHRPPFLLVDKIMHISENSIVGIKNVTMNEAFFVGHFPDEPVMPGVLQIEAMAQTGGILLLKVVDNPQDYLTYFLKIDKVKFKKKVVPGDTIVFRLELLSPVKRGIATMKGEGFVNGQLVIEGELTAMISRKPKIETIKKK